MTRSCGKWLRSHIIQRMQRWVLICGESFGRWMVWSYYDTASDIRGRRARVTSRYPSLCDRMTFIDRWCTPATEQWTRNVSVGVRWALVLGVETIKAPPPPSPPHRRAPAFVRLAGVIACISGKCHPTYDRNCRRLRSAPRLTHCCGGRFERVRLTRRRTVGGGREAVTAVSDNGPTDDGIATPSGRIAFGEPRVVTSS